MAIKHRIDDRFGDQIEFFFDPCAQGNDADCAPPSPPADLQWSEGWVGGAVLGAFGGSMALQMPAIAATISGAVAILMRM